MSTAENIEFRRADGKAMTAGALVFIRPSELSASGTTGVILQGTYLGPVDNALTGKTDYKFERSSDGATVILNGAGNLSSQMKNVSEGQLCRINYNGKVKIKTGAMAGKMAHNFVVEVA